MASGQATRKQLGAWYTPDVLIGSVLDGILDGIDLESRSAQPLRVLDPACGDGRFLAALAARSAGRRIELTGCDIDANALATAQQGGDLTAIHANALNYDWGDTRFDLVIGNPPFLSQMSALTTRGGSSRHGGGPYADTAAEFLSLAVHLVKPEGGRIGLILPQSILGSRDAGLVRDDVADRSDLIWSWWSPDQADLFDASVHVCGLGFETSSSPRPHPPWTTVVTDRLGIPRLGMLATDGTIGDRATTNANFRDEYYALVPAVSDDADGPALVTSGVIDPGHCWWGERPIRFARNRFDHPRIDLDQLHGRFSAWATRKLVPKVIVANQTRIVEAVADVAGAWLPGVPTTTVIPDDPNDVEPIAAVLTSPVASAWCWHHTAGTGLSPRAVRVTPGVIASVPWPRGDLSTAIAALRQGDVNACGRVVTAAYGIDDDALMTWWSDQLPVSSHRPG